MYKLAYRFRKRGITIVEVIFALGLFSLLMLAAYRLFFYEIKSIRFALEHIGINESARKLFAQFGNDIRNANWVDFPVQVQRETVSSLAAINEGKILILRRQEFDFEQKPPMPDFLREETIEYYLKKCKDGTSDLYRKSVSDMPGSSGKSYERKICDGIFSMMVYTTSKKPVRIKESSNLLPLKGSIDHEPYEINGTGPYLVHFKVSFVRKNERVQSEKRQAALTVSSCFSVRGRLNAIHP